MNEQEKKTVKKLGNKGFTLIELIIVIAIIAILAVTLAPQLMKYIGKSKDASDKNNKASITESINTALSDEKAYSSVIAAKTNVKVTAKAGDKTCTSTAADLKTEVDSIIKEWPQVKESGKTGWEVEIEVKQNGSSYEVGSVTVKAV